MTPDQVRQARRWTLVSIVTATIGTVGLLIAGQWWFAAALAALGVFQVFQLRRLSRYGGD